MAGGKIIRCECGYGVRARAEEPQVAEIRRHAWEAHSISFSTEEALAVLLRLELEVAKGAPADLAAATDTTSGKEQEC